MTEDYSWITQKMFDDAFENLIVQEYGQGAWNLINEVPNVLSDVIEHMNNRVIEKLEEERDGETQR